MQQLLYSCPRCQAEVDLQDNFCQTCGTRLLSVRMSAAGRSGAPAVQKVFPSGEVQTADAGIPPGAVPGCMETVPVDRGQKVEKLNSPWKESSLESFNRQVLGAKASGEYVKPQLSEEKADLSDPSLVPADEAARLDRASEFSISGGGSAFSEETAQSVDQLELLASCGIGTLYGSGSDRTTFSAQGKHSDLHVTDSGGSAEGQGTTLGKRSRAKRLSRLLDPYGYEDAGSCVADFVQSTGSVKAPASVKQDCSGDPSRPAIDWCVSVAVTVFIGASIWWGVDRYLNPDREAISRTFEAAKIALGTSTPQRAAQILDASPVPLPAMLTAEQQELFDLSMIARAKHKSARGQDREAIADLLRIPESSVRFGSTRAMVKECIALSRFAESQRRIATGRKAGAADSVGTTPPPSQRPESAPVKQSADAQEKAATQPATGVQQAVHVQPAASVRSTTGVQQAVHSQPATGARSTTGVQPAAHSQPATGAQSTTGAQAALREPLDTGSGHAAASSSANDSGKRSVMSDTQAGGQPQQPAGQRDWNTAPRDGKPRLAAAASDQDVARYHQLLEDYFTRQAWVGENSPAEPLSLKEWLDGGKPAF